MKSEVQVLLEKQIKLLEDIIVGKDKIIEMQKEKIASSQPYLFPSYPTYPFPSEPLYYVPTVSKLSSGNAVTSGFLRVMEN